MLPRSARVARAHAIRQVLLQPALDLRLRSGPYQPVDFIPISNYEESRNPLYAEAGRDIGR